MKASCASSIRFIIGRKLAEINSIIEITKLCQIFFLPKGRYQWNVAIINRNPSNSVCTTPCLPMVMVYIPCMQYTGYTHISLFLCLVSISG